jgi:hypothetical protein
LMESACPLGGHGWQLLRPFGRAGHRLRACAARRRRHRCRSTHSGAIWGSSRCPSRRRTPRSFIRDGVGPGTWCSTRTTPGDRSRRLRTPCASSAEGANQVNRNLWRPLSRRRSAGNGTSSRLLRSFARELHLPHRPPDLSFVGPDSSAPGPTSLPAGLELTTRSNPGRLSSARLPPFGGIGCARFLIQFPCAARTPLSRDGSFSPASSGESSPPCYSIRLVEHLAAPAEREWRRCVFPTCATVDLPYEHPIRIVRFPLRSQLEEGALDDASSASAHSRHSPSAAGGRIARLVPGGSPPAKARSRAARTAGVFDEAASCAPPERRIQPFRG